MKHLNNRMNMKFNLVLITVFTFFILISCGPAKQDSGQKQQVPALQQNQEQPSSINAEPDQPVEAETTEQPSMEQNNAEVMRNPPHGEPFHRCDIPVGAPLNSPPANTTRQTTEQTSAEVMRNPPHGEPNHRCDIPVGAPLNSAPANTTRQTTNSQVQATSPQNINTAPDIANNPTAPTIENARRMNNSQTQSTVAPTTGTKPRLNPAHGQPGHRCDIAVGSPLP